jgi:hypothetical protein
MEAENSAHFLETARFEFVRMKALAEKAMAQVSDAEFERTLSASSISNSVKIIVQHVAGNLLSRWTDFLTSDGEKEWRNRDAEFEDQEISRAALMEKWEQGWKTLFAALDTVSPGHLLQNVYIRREPLTVTQALIRQISHYSYHVGQIVQLAKEWKGEEWQTLSIAKGKSKEHNSGNYLDKK